MTAAGTRIFSTKFHGGTQLLYNCIFSDTPLIRGCVEKSNVFRRHIGRFLVVAVSDIYTRNTGSVIGLDPMKCLVAEHSGLFVPDTQSNKHTQSYRQDMIVKLYSGVQHSLQECKGVWWMPWLQEAMKDVIWLR